MSLLPALMASLALQTGVAEAVGPALDRVCMIPASASARNKRRRARAAGFEFWGDFYEIARADGSIAARVTGDSCSLDMMLERNALDGVDRELQAWAAAQGLTQTLDQTAEGVAERDRYRVNGGRLSWSVTRSQADDEPALILVTWRPRG